MSMVIEFLNIINLVVIVRFCYLCLIFKWAQLLNFEL